MALTRTRFWKLIRYPSRKSALDAGVALDANVETYEVQTARDRLGRELSDHQADWPKELKNTPATHYLGWLEMSSSQASMASRLRRVAHFFGLPDWHQVAWENLQLEDLAVFRSAMNEEVLDPETGETKRLMSPELFNSTRAAVRGTAKAAFELRLIDADHLKRLESVKGLTQARRDKPKGRMLYLLEQHHIMEALPDDEPMSARDRAIFATLLFAGLRRSEVANLRMRHIVLGEKISVVGSKRRQSREIPMSEHLFKALMGWLRHYHSENGRQPRDDDPLFCRLGRWGVVSFEPITGQAVYDIVARLCRRQDLQKALPHDLRRTFISMILDATQDISSAKDLAGHGNPATTAIYDLRGERAARKSIEALDALYGGDDS